MDQLRQDLAVARKELQYSTEPQAYLLEALRTKEHELLDLRRMTKSQESELQRSRQQAENAISSKLLIEEDLKKLLAQREHLESLRAVLGCDARSGAVGAEPALRAEHRAEHRGRAPSQQQPSGRQQTPAVGKPWHQKLREKNQAASPADSTASTPA